MAETQHFSGSCLCGAVRFELDGVPVRFYHCHCSRCRKSTGSAHGSNVFVKTDRLRWSGNTDGIRTYKVPDAERFARSFCETCGGALPREISAMSLALIPAGTIDSDNELRPEARIFWDSRAAWSCTDDIQTWPEGPPRTERTRR